MLKKIIVIMLILVFSVFCFVGCNEQKNNESITEVVNFKEMEDDQRKDYVLNHIKEKYNVNGIIREPINAMSFYYSNDFDTYYACVETDDFYKICCWIKEDGTIVDSGYTRNMQNNISKMFEPIIKKYVKKYKIVPVVWMQDYQKVWEIGQESEMMKTEKGMFIEVYVFINTSEMFDFKKAIEENFDNELNFANGTINVEYVEDVDKVNLANKSMYEYDLGYGFGITPDRDLMD